MSTRRTYDLVTCLDRAHLGKWSFFIRLTRWPVQAFEQKSTAAKGGGYDTREEAHAAGMLAWQNYHDRDQSFEETRLHEDWA